MIHQSVFNYLNPGNHNTPLIELDNLSQFENTGARIFIKMAPLGNIKSIPAHHMLMQAKESGQLEGVHTLVEASSGNMSIALSDLCPYFGIRSFLAIIANDTALGKQQELNLKGAQIQFTNTLPQGVSAIQYAEELGGQKGFLNLRQYANPHNPQAYEKHLAPQIHKELTAMGFAEHPLVICASMGTCGTILGCGRYFKQVHRNCRVIGVHLLPGEMVPGARDENRLKEITLPWDKVVSLCIQIGRYKSYARSLELIHKGLDAGPSSGLALAGLLEYLESNERRKNVIAVFISADSYKPYVDKYGTILNDEEFKKKVLLST